MSEINNSSGAAQDRSGKLAAEVGAPGHLFAAIASSRRIVRCVIMFLVAVLLLVFAFCPIAKTVAVVDGEEYSIKFNSIDFAKIAYYSLCNRAEGEIPDTSVYKDLVSSGYYEGRDLKSLSNAKAAAMLKNMLFLELLSSGGDVKVTALVAAAFVILYLGSCILLFAKSALSLAREGFSLLGKKHIENKTADMGGAILFRLLMHLPLLGYLAPLGCYFGVADSLSVYSAGGTGTAIGFWLSVLITFFGTAFFLIHRLINVSRDGELKFSRLKSELISFAFIVVLLVSLFFPSISADVMVRRGSSVDEEALKIGYSDIIELSMNDVIYYSEMSRDDAEHLLIEGLSSGKTDSLDKTLMSVVTVGIGRVDPSYLYVAIAIINIFVILLSASLSAKLIKKAVYFRRVKRVTIIKVLLIMLSLVQCVLVFIACIIANESAGTPIDLALHFSISASPVIALVAAVGALVSSDKTDPDEKIIDDYYDNPDISYAPYVVGFKKK